MPSSRTSRRCARLTSLVLAGALLALAGCDDSSATPPEENEPPPEQPPQHDGTPGQLFIMGGGSRTDGMVSRMIEEAGLENGRLRRYSADGQLRAYRRRRGRA